MVKNNKIEEINVYCDSQTKLGFLIEELWSDNTKTITLYSVEKEKEIRNALSEGKEIKYININKVNDEKLKQIYKIISNGVENQEKDINKRKNNIHILKKKEKILKKAMEKKTKVRKNTTKKIIIGIACGTIVIYTTYGAYKLIKNNLENKKNVSMPQTVIDSINYTQNPISTNIPKPTATPDSKFYFNAYDINNITDIAAKLLIQVNKIEELNLSELDILNLILVANNIYPGEVLKDNNLDFTSDVFESLVAIEKIDMKEAIKAYITNNNFEKSDKIDIKNIFSNKKDRAYVSVFVNKKQDILNAIANKNEKESTKLIKEYFELECKAIIKDEPIETDEGKIEFTSLNDFARTQIITSSFPINAALKLKYPNHSISYDDKIYTIDYVVKGIGKINTAIINAIKANMYEKHQLVSNEDKVNKKSN